MTMRYILCFYVILGVAVAGVDDPAHRIIFWAAIGAMILIVHMLVRREQHRRATREAIEELARQVNGYSSKSDQS